MNLMKRSNPFLWLFFSLGLFLVIFWVSSVAVWATPKFSHTVSITDPKTSLVHITTNITDLNQSQVELALPNWTPGYYVTENYAANLQRLTFLDQNGKVLQHQKETDSMWRLDTHNVSAIKIDFDYLANQLDLNKSKIFPNYALLNGTNFFFYLKDHTIDIPETVTFQLPTGWNIATGLDSTANAMVFNAENYDVLVDCPILVGEFDLVTLLLQNVPHKLAVVPKGILGDRLQKIAENYIKVIETQTKVFGEIPYHQYLTINIFENNGLSNGGLEHSNSYVGLNPRPGLVNDEYIQNLNSLTAHEFFHAFNVKRIRPSEMWPYRYDVRNYTKLLWVSEGITDYYTFRGLLRANLMTQEQYLQAVGSILSFVQAAEPAKYISVEEASINTWLGGAGGRRQAFAVDYYSRGCILGMLLDISIRQDSVGKASLDDVMRALYQECYKKNHGFTTSDLLSIINRLTHKNYSSFFEKYVSGTETLPVEEILSTVGLRLETKKSKIPRLGIALGNDNQIITIVPGKTAEMAGIKVGDIFLGAGNYAVNNPDWLIELRKAYADKDGEPITFYLLRDGKPLLLPAKLGLDEDVTSTLEKIPDSSPEKKEFLNKWLAVN